MAGIRVKINHRGMAELLAAPEVRAELTRRMERVLDKARETAPVDTGDYRDKLQILQDTTDRAVVRVGSTSNHAWIVESNTGNLSRALDEAGGD